jgi:hypothetical protein
VCSQQFNGEYAPASTALACLPGHAGSKLNLRSSIRSFVSSVSCRAHLLPTQYRTPWPFSCFDQQHCQTTNCLISRIMLLKFLLAVGLIPGTVYGWPAHVSRGVECDFSTAPDIGATCESFASGWGISVVDLQSLNPGINCPDFGTDTVYCVIGTITNDPPTSSPRPNTTASTKPSTSSASPIVTKTSSTVTSTTATGSGITTPQPTQPEMVSNCNKFFFVARNFNCNSVLSSAQISLADLFKWNPSILVDCSGLWAEVNVCVGVTGGATTIATPRPSTTTPIGNGIQTPQPTQPEMIRNCAKFHYVAKGVTCSQITSYQHISLTDFVKWNPTVGSDCRAMQSGVNICVGLIGATTTTNKPTTTTTAGNGIQTPQPTQPGMVLNCKKFHWVAEGVTCSQIISYQKITLANFVKWNTGVGSNCNTMWSGNNVCVGV